MKWVLRAFSPGAGGKATGNEADHSLATSAQAKNAWNCTSITIHLQCLSTVDIVPLNQNNNLLLSLGVFFLEISRIGPSGLFEFRVNFWNDYLYLDMLGVPGLGICPSQALCLHVTSQTLKIDAYSCTQCSSAQR
jgi:hypothetical protein